MELFRVRDQEVRGLTHGLSKEVTCQGFTQVVDRSRETVPRSERAARVARGRRMAVMKCGRWRGWQHEPQDGRGSQPIVGGQGGSSLWPGPRRGMHALLSRSGRGLGSGGKGEVALKM